MKRTILAVFTLLLNGQTMQQIIHEKLIEKAKEKLSTTRLSVSEIAYQSSILSLSTNYLKARPNKAHWISVSPSTEMRM